MRLEVCICMVGTILALTNNVGVLSCRYSSEDRSYKLAAEREFHFAAFKRLQSHKLTDDLVIRFLDKDGNTRL